jgi:2,5-furandicarboxylate decarboxylase 1
LLGEPLDVVRCVGSDLLVPAHCECVLEGTLDAGEPFDGGAGQRISRPLRKLRRRHRGDVHAPDAAPRRDVSGDAAGLSSGALPARRRRDRGRLGARRPSSVPAVREVAVGMGGAGRLHAVVSLRAPRPGDARKAMFAIWAAVNLIKQVVVVDDDIDPWDRRRSNGRSPRA